MSETNGRIVRPLGPMGDFATRDEVVRVVTNACREVYHQIGEQHGKAFTTLEQSIEEMVTAKFAAIESRLQAFEGLSRS